jgi:hypothetical protein
VKVRSTAARAALSILVGTVVSLSALAGSGETARKDEFAPDAAAKGASPFRDGAWRVETASYAAELSLVEGAARLAIARRRLGPVEDPFAPLPGATSTLLTFFLRIENRGKGELVFEPDATRLSTRDHQVWHPIGWPDIESAYALLEREVPPAQGRAKTLMIDGQKIVPPGKAVEGILVFRMPPAGTKRFRVDVPLTLPDGSGAGLGAAYQVVRK